MRRFLSVIGLIAVVLVVLVAVGVLYLAWRGTRLGNEAASYSSDAVRAITAHWDSSELTARASPELGRALSPGQLERMFTWFATLGPLRGQPTCSGGAFINATPAGTTTTGRYNCPAQYQNGAATISVLLVKRGNGWRISGFNVLSPVLIPNSPAQKI